MFLTVALPDLSITLCAVSLRYMWHVWLEYSLMICRLRRNLRVLCDMGVQKGRIHNVCSQYMLCAGSMDSQT